MKLKDLLPSKLGFGSAPLGNMFRQIPDAEALETVETAWESGIRYFDTAPFYGAGLAEMRLGEALSRFPREDYVISTKVGHLILDEVEEKTNQSTQDTRDIFKYGRPNKVVHDYSYDATMRSIEGSLKRLNTDRIEIVWVHDVAQDFYGDQWLGIFESARKGAFVALDKLRDEGVLQAWGLGVNRVEPIELLLELEEPRPDGLLLAGRYSLLDHSKALQRVIPQICERGLGIVAGGPYSSGALVGGPNFEYAPAPESILQKVAKIKAIGEKYGVSNKAIGLQFVLANPAVAAVIPGASKPSRIKEDIEALETDIPKALWQELRQEHLVDDSAPLPTGK
ncbi:aldo/keto reductase [Microbulbifer sp. CnH-101-G]|uniref:aldo/keto reductase n=1 Tax=Microbulbifer sp. CnH-101-G TaxID=3243393 RepID=UPI00403A1716